MELAIRNEIKALGRMGYTSCFFCDNAKSLSNPSPFIHCYRPQSLVVDIYSWEREVSGKGNDGRDWDIDQCDQRMLVIPFGPTKASFRRAYRLARMCARLPSTRS